MLCGCPNFTPLVSLGFGRKWIYIIARVGDQMEELTGWGHICIL